MDRGGSRARLLTAAALLLIAASPADPPLRAARWLAPGASITALARQPAECLGAPIAGEAAIGRVAFRTPLLLGGQGARVGLSCSACHRNGRGNPQFHFPGLSDAPGTADVTASLMSAHRGDGVFNPRPIPDLAGPSRGVSRATGDPALEHFVHGLIVEEFDGPEPPPRVLAGVAAYVRAINPAACPRQTDEPITLATFLADADHAIDAALFAWGQGDRATARLMLAGGRAALGLIDERYAALPEARQAPRDADLELRAAQQAIDAGGFDIPERLAAWRTAMKPRAALLRRWESRSLFNPASLTEATASPTP